MKTPRARRAPPRIDVSGTVRSSWRAQVGLATLTGRLPLVVVRIDGNAESRRKFAKRCKALNIDARPVQFLDHEQERPFVFDCVGSRESLMSLAEHWTVNDFHCALSARVPTGPAKGTGEVGHNARRAIRESKVGKRERFVIADAESFKASIPIVEMHPCLDSFDEEFTDTACGDWKRRQNKRARLDAERDERKEQERLRALPVAELVKHIMAKKR